MASWVHPHRFAGKVVVVTGAAQGIGLAVARRVAAESGLVVLIDRAEVVHDVAQSIRDFGGEAHSISADLELYEHTVSAMSSAHAWHGRIDVLINNVGGTIWAKPFEHYAPAEIQQEIQRSLFPTLWSCHAVLPFLIEQQSGVIVNVSSVATRGVNRVPYAAAKGGVGAITAALAMETARHGIRVVATAPGGTDAPERQVARGPLPTGVQEKAWYQEIVDQTIDSSWMKRYGTLDEQTAPIVFLASDEATYLTGTVLPVAGGDRG
ncbi:1,6-dihydroxycyclohexa-2,4-diene-1-carboxylate dehydrogenase [Cryobacterium sp. Hz9]|uniref:1,6-dihydroxycyclohexa-2,4-diene-1-carboxylate dehydrogenase n=1 Tax=Cryobacterium sp. Hz9 TaxID=1259167 RepID=UPI00106B23AC|nr:1,6-dihydroxycyclohexa-2,4-diene-1-carboxylate dehydrogenase [Cryobacterium sp. Hz9]TFB68064.1 1,6-dihydroxycyclohexa-2,4-diene-1-carboxylate dehydrogenase [Cryobacterium sp. Hz9]